MTIETVRVPDLGGAEEVEVIELSVAVGDRVEVDQTLLVLESEKATMELPSPVAGVVARFLVAEGDKIKKAGIPLLEITIDGAAAAKTPAEAGAPATSTGAAKSGTAKSVQPTRVEAPKPASASAAVSVTESALPAAAAVATPVATVADAGVATAQTPTATGAEIYAGPYVRRLARELGVELARVAGSGPRQRIQKEDVQAFVRQRLAQPVAAAVGGGAIPAVPDVDYAKFGPVTTGELSKIGRLTAANMHRSWLNVPHVTQFDAADISELETFRQTRKGEAEARGVKLTPVPFILKACAIVLRDNPVLNRALAPDGAHFVQREYFHLGMAVDTPRGLLVPVVRDVDRKGIWELAAEVAALGDKARAGKLTTNEMQGACFTISSLGALGGGGFTPIVNTPEVGILGVSRAAVQPVWNGHEFMPRTMLPLALSYDHRVVNGGDGGRVLTQLVALLSDIRLLLM
ncbi:MAG: 2-oxo acid dehydrogenase subunit E2 [Gammaproteobacteria bacterium]|nr:2-oxo acid dehydrogenase subunit E2 [Gammaproteobacteria bacterium]MBK9426945.1 2-oxo acid dehydrogenase subunit E2 [Gammaproteobacteria bacterium]